MATYSPPFKSLPDVDHGDIARRVREARLDILLVAFSCPEQEKWIRTHYRQLGVPLSIGVGATVHVGAGAMRRAPVWMHRSGLEWAFRLLQEAKRLFRRCACASRVFGQSVLSQCSQLGTRRRSHRQAGEARILPRTDYRSERARLSGFPDAPSIRRQASLWTQLANSRKTLPLDASGVDEINSNALGCLVRLQKHAADSKRHSLRIAPSAPLRRALVNMHLQGVLTTAHDDTSARELAERWEEEFDHPVRVSSPAARTEGGPDIPWRGEVVAPAIEVFWDATWPAVKGLAPERKEAAISLAEVCFLDSAGVGLMARLRTTARQQGVDVRFRDPGAPVRGVLRILRMDTVVLQ